MGSNFGDAIRIHERQDGLGSPIVDSSELTDLDKWVISLQKNVHFFIMTCPIGTQFNLSLPKEKIMGSNLENAIEINENT